MSASDTMSATQAADARATRIHIPPELFLPAETMHFQGEVVLPAMKFGPDLYTFAHPLAWEVDATNTGEALLLEGTCEVLGKTACARCGEPADVPLFGEIEGYFFLDAQSVSKEDKEEDEFDVLPVDHIIDLLPLIQAAITLDIPVIPLCDDDCKGLCPVCGANLNEGDCGCQTEDDFNPDSPFAALKGFTVD